MSNLMGVKIGDNPRIAGLEADVERLRGRRNYLRDRKNKYKEKAVHNARVATDAKWHRDDYERLMKIYKRRYELIASIVVVAGTIGFLIGLAVAL